MEWQMERDSGWSKSVIALEDMDGRCIVHNQMDKDEHTWGCTVCIMHLF
jgi:hypothetical protein